MMSRNLKYSFVSALLSLSVSTVAMAADKAPATPAQGDDIPAYLKKYLPAYLSGTMNPLALPDFGGAGAGDNSSAVFGGVSSPVMVFSNGGDSGANNAFVAPQPLKQPAPAPAGGGLNPNAKPAFHPAYRLIDQSKLRSLPGVGSGIAGGYSPEQIRHVYGFDQLRNTGIGQTIAIVDAYGSPTLNMDLAIFSQTYALPQANIQVVNQGNIPDRSVFEGDPVIMGWAVETTLDIEWAHAMAPGAKILLVVAASDSSDDLFAAVDLAVAAGANVVSMSFGGDEYSDELTDDVMHFKNPSKKGVTFVAATGDTLSGFGPAYPSVSPYVLAVGGTSLSLDANGDRLSEVVWNDGLGGGTGGGISNFETRPVWQNGWVPYLNRSVPDVSYEADPNNSPGFDLYFTLAPFLGYNNAWMTVGGTSAGAPQWAALVALINSAKVGNVSIGLYSLAGLDYPLFFYDVTSGDNGAFGAMPHWDATTGLGSPNAQWLALFLGAGVH